MNIIGSTKFSGNFRYGIITDDPEEISDLISHSWIISACSSPVPVLVSPHLRQWQDHNPSTFQDQVFF